MPRMNHKQLGFFFSPDFSFVCHYFFVSCSRTSYDCKCISVFCFLLFFESFFLFCMHFTINRLSAWRDSIFLSCKAWIFLYYFINNTVTCQIFDVLFKWCSIRCSITILCRVFTEVRYTIILFHYSYFLNYNF